MKRVCTVRIGPELESVRERSVVPPGLESLLGFFPALKRRAIFIRPSGASSLLSILHETVPVHAA
jgi:hypothetical protein